LIIFYQLTDRVGRTWMFSAVWQGLVALIASSSSPPLSFCCRHDLPPCSAGCRSGGYLRAWGFAATVSHHLSLPLLPPARRSGG
jgi:hypothetical protein